MRILLVEDDAILGAAVRDHIVESSHSVDWVIRLDAAADHLASATYDLVLLDMMLPDGHGIGFLRNLRMKGCATPVIILTALDQISDRILGLNAGADDYLTKPFSFRVLVARLRALERRGAPERPVVLTAGTLSLDPARHTVERESTPITLTPREYGLLEFLMRNKDTVVTKAEILSNVWDAHYQGPDNVVEVYVGYLRRKIDVPFDTNTIETIRGAGYRLLC